MRRLFLWHLLVPLLLAVTQFGCDAEYGADIYPHEIRNLKDVRERLEAEKREFLKIKDVKVGDGPVAAWGRRLEADMRVWYEDGTLVYEGPVVSYFGFHIGLYNGLKDRHLLASGQPGVHLGINGMAVGGIRRFTVDSRLVCEGVRMGPDPKAACVLVYLTRGPGWSKSPRVRKDKIVVEATLVDSCIPLSFRAIRAGGSYLIYKQIGCRDSDIPKLDPKFPIWHVY